MRTNNKTGKVGIIIQARLGSTRLPGKVLRPLFNNNTLISVLVNNLKRSLYYTGDNLIIATTKNSCDDKLAAYATGIGVSVIRGSEENVLDRFIQSGAGRDFEHMVRICSDNIFTDIALMDFAISYQMANEAIDYVSFGINNTPAMLTHYGFFSEVIKYDALKRFHQEIAETKDDFEHVTKGIYTRPELFSTHFIDLSVFFNNSLPIRTTVDTAEDFAITDQLYRELSMKKKQWCFIEVLNHLNNRQELISVMEKLILSNKKQ